MTLTQKTDRCDIAIVGGGLVGASLAVALEPLARSQQWDVRVLEAKPFSDTPPEQSWQPSFDARSSALAWGTREIYQQLGLWEMLSRHAEPIKTIHVSDRGHLGSTRMQASEQGVDALGYVVPNSWLGHTLWHGLRQSAHVKVMAPVDVQGIDMQPDGGCLDLGDDGLLSAQLVVLADGGRSGLKQQLGIEDTTQDYEQVALVANVRLSQPHQNIAYERFDADGPLALLPLGGQDMAVVWTRSRDTYEAALALDDRAFMDQLQQIIGHRVGAFEHVGARYHYPLQLVQAKEQVRRHLAVLGNAAHYLHPVAGQGYNLAIRGVMDLVSTLSEAAQAGAEPGDLTWLQRYEAKRRGDQRDVITFSDGLIRMFANAHPLLGHMRAAGLIALSAVGPARRWLARRAMGV